MAAGWGVRRGLHRMGLCALAFGAALTAAAPAQADRALLISLDDYGDKRLNLANPGSSAKDVADVTRLLTGALAFRPEDIRTLRDSAATRAAILAAFDQWLVQGTKPGERVFVYFSGLGYYQPDQNGDEADGLDETLLPYDAAVGSGEPLAISGAVVDDELTDLLLKLAGRRVAVVIDAGYSGIVTSGSGAGDVSDLRAPQLRGSTRQIVVEKKALDQKAKGAPMDTARLGQEYAVYAAVSGGQAPIIESGGGIFTRAFVDAVELADVNGNGTISNAEILAFLRTRSERACAAHPSCQLGLTPTFGPEGATGRALFGAPAGAAGPAKLTADGVLDYFAKGNAAGVTLEQFPPSPVALGAKDIRFRVTSPVAGTLVLLDLSDKGELTQLFPNQYSRDREREGRIRAGAAITVPDAYYGIRFDATSANSGTLIALVTVGPVDMPATVKTRKIEVIPAAEATKDYLPALAGALTTPAGRTESTATHAVDWSVATLRYKIGP